ncbi:MAG: NAD(P)/FAD-dependent oxidoreductase [Thermodesulfobacteriota bacterium]|nr:NAD(P)/FAD-dependent oxidoreductase [Thermodesulfobacteriota bacterium]
MIDAIVVGAGYGGMSVAALLAHSKKRVLVIEASTLIGGRASTFTDEGGYTWEYGAHSHRLADKGIANQVMRRLGDEIEFTPEAKGAKLIFKSSLWNRPEGPLGFLTTKILGFSGRITLLRLLVKIKGANPYDWYDKSLLEFYHSWFHNKEVEAFLPFLGMTVMCSDPSKVSAGEVIEFLQRVLAAGVGVGEPVGGSGRIFSKLRSRIEKNGEIHLGEKVTDIIIENSIVKGVVTDKEKYESDKVIFAARLPLLFDVIKEDVFDKAFVTYCKGIEHSSGLSIDFITDAPGSQIKAGILGVDIPIWAKFQSNSDPTLTPPGKHLSTWGIMLPWGFDGDPEEADKAEQRLKATISNLFPEFLPKLKKERKLVAHIMNGTVLTPRQSKPNRPDVVCKEIKGLYFVGDTVRGDGCSGDISFSSAMKVADHITVNSEE